MAIEFIYDEKLDKAKKDLGRVIKTVDQPPLNKRGLFLRRFFFACVKATEIIDRKNMLEEHKQQFKKIPLRKILPQPPRPHTQMIPLLKSTTQIPPIPEPPAPEF